MFSLMLWRVLLRINTEVDSERKDVAGRRRIIVLGRGSQFFEKFDSKFQKPDIRRRRCSTRLTFILIFTTFEEPSRILCLLPRCLVAEYFLLPVPAIPHLNGCSQFRDDCKVVITSVLPLNFSPQIQ